ncbi:hypothetical protein MP638_006516 [Amoeboaphelidium occidentale]|nr:hypothetical protein MP638_006516 [Amoeboaphelidium occidentale]
MQEFSNSSTPTTPRSSYKYLPNQLALYTGEGNHFAGMLLEASCCFWRAMLLLDNGSDIQSMFSFLCKAIQLAEIVCIFTDDMKFKLSNAIDAVFEGNILGVTEEQARICYFVLHMNESKHMKVFLDASILKYPNNWIFYRFRACNYGFLKQYQKGIPDINKAIDLYSGNKCELTYEKAVLMKLSYDLKTKSLADLVVKEYLEFIRLWSKDNRKLPESYYSIGCIQVVRGDLKCAFEWYQKGLEAEKTQLPIFLPYESTSKIQLEMVAMTFKERPSQSRQTPEAEGSSTVKTSAHIKDSLSNNMAIANFRSAGKEWASTVRSGKNVLYFTSSRSVDGKKSSSSKLKDVSFSDLDMRKDSINEGSIMSVTIFDKHLRTHPSLPLLVFDRKGDVQRMFVYNLKEAASNEFAIGSEILIRNPRTRLFNDGGIGLRVDDPDTIVFTGEGVKNMCRCCGAPSEPVKRCSRCKTFLYCSKDCQVRDWFEFKHKEVCEEMN